MLRDPHQAPGADPAAGLGGGRAAMLPGAGAAGVEGLVPTDDIGGLDHVEDERSLMDAHQELQPD